MERRKQRNRFLIIIVLLLLFFGSWCLNKKSKDSVERNNPKYEIIDDGGIPNTFRVVNNAGNTMRDASGNLMEGTKIGSFSFSVPSGTEFSIEVTGNPKLGSGDVFDIEGTRTVTVNALSTP